MGVSRVLSSRGFLLALALYFLLLLASFYPQSARPQDTIAYVGDSLESVYLVAWNVHQFFRAPTRLFEANVLYPHRRALAFTDHRLLPSLAVAPALWATGNPGLTAGRLPRLALAGAVAASLFAPIALPYVRAAREQGYARELVPGIGLEHYVSTSPTNLIYGAIGAEVRLQQRGPHFVGFVSL